MRQVGLYEHGEDSERILVDDTVAVNVKLHSARPWHLKNRYLVLVAASVKLHGTRPWHLKMSIPGSYSNERETPRRKAVASFNFLLSCSGDLSEVLEAI